MPAQALAQQALSLARDADNALKIAKARNAVGWAMIFLGPIHDAMAEFPSASQLFAISSDRIPQINALTGRGIVSSWSTIGCYGS